MDEITAVASLRPNSAGPTPAAVAAASTRLQALTAAEGAGRGASWGRATLRWQLAGAVAVSIAVVGGLTAAEALRDPGRDGPPAIQPAAVTELLGQAARTAAAQPYTAPRPDQFGFQDQLIDERDSDGRHREQSRSWRSVGDADAVPAVCSRPVTKPPATFDCAQPGHSMTLPTTTNPPIGSYEYLSALPRDPQRLLDTLQRDVAIGREQPEPTLTAGVIVDLVADPLTPPDLRAALLTAVARIAGVTKIDKVTDAAGRTGTAAAWTEGGLRHELIFDPGSHDFLGYRMVLVTPGRYTDLAGLPAGTVVLSRALLDSGIVDHARQLP